MKLYEEVLYAIEGQATETGVMHLADGQTREFERTYFVPDRWIDRACSGSVMAIECLALVLFAVRKGFDPDHQRQIVDQWAAQLRAAAETGEVKARDPDSLLPLSTIPDGWHWMISMVDADAFVTNRGMGWTCTERAEHIRDQRDAVSAPAAPVSSPPGGTHWPWGAHETNLLRHLSAAADKFWKLYEPADESTAPLNDQVIEWLISERKVSRKVAEVMATILRADGLKTGPRK